MQDNLSPEQIEEIKREMALAALLNEQTRVLNADAAAPGGDELPATMRTPSPLERFLESIGRRPPQPEIYDPSWEQPGPSLASRAVPAGDDGVPAFPPPSEVSRGEAWRSIAPSGLDWVGDGMDAVGGIADGIGEAAYDVYSKPYLASGAQMVEDGAGYAYEGMEEGKPLKTVGGVGMMATPAVMALNPLMRTAFNGPVKATLSGGMIGASPQLAAEAFGAKNALASEDQMMMLLKQQSTLQQRAQAAADTMRREQESGRGPKWEAAKREYDDLSSSLKAVDAQITHMRNATSPEELRKQKRLDQESEANVPFREKYPWAVPAVQSGAGALAGFLGWKGQAGRAGEFNRATDDISQRWEKSIKAANDPTDLLAAGRGAREAQGYGAMMDRLERPGKLDSLAAFFTPSKGGSAAFAAGDAAPMMPLIVDKMQAQPGSELEKQTKEELSFDNWKDIASRMAAGGIFNMIPYKAGKAMGPDKKTPKRYDAESEALAPFTKDKNGIEDHYRGFTERDGVDVERIYQDRRRRRQVADGLERVDKELLETPAGRKDLREAERLQQQQNQRQSRRGESSSQAQDTSSYLKAREAYHTYKKRKNAKPERTQQLLTKLRSEQAKAQSKKGGRWDGGYSE